MHVYLECRPRADGIDRGPRWVVWPKAAGRTELRILLVMLGTVALLSAFVNNTPVVVVFMPVILALSRQLELKASRFPDSAFVRGDRGGNMYCDRDVDESHRCGDRRTGGARGLSGCSSRHGWEYFFVIITLVYLVVFGRRLLPDRVTTSASLFESEEGREFLTQAVIGDDSPLVGQALCGRRRSRRSAIRASSK